jgi:hypothetical protein
MVFQSDMALGHQRHLLYIPLGALAAGLYLNSARLLFQLKVDGILWGFIGLALSAALVIAGGRVMDDLMTLFLVGSALKWCDFRISKSAEESASTGC